MLSKGQKINERYEIVKSIGEGGMANVYLAKDNILERDVAVKVLRGDLSADEKFIRRFEREAQSVSNLSHPNIVEVYDVGVEDGNHYIVMEYIDGKTLKQLLKKRDSLTLIEVIDIMSQLTDGLAHAHESYIIHRDIKPQNIMIEDNGLIKITDFGIAMALNATQLTQTNSVMGSVHYLPPEQASGKGATIKSDIYSLGILMYELLTGNVPFKGDNAVEIALKHMKDKIPSITKQNPAIPQSVENILMKATAKNPKNRYDSVKDMYNDFVACLNEEHLHDKKIVYEYPENDFDDTDNNNTKVEIKKVNESTQNLVTEIENENKEIEFFEEPQKRNTLITILLSFFLLLLITGGIILIVGMQEVQDITVPDVTEYSLDAAIAKLEEAGFTYTTEQAKSETIEIGKVIRTNPRAGSTRKKGSTITIIESIGGTYYYLENYVDKKYTEVKAKLELIGVNVLIERKDIENKEDYKGKEDIIIEQSPAFDNKNQTLIETGDTVILYIPNIVDEYPDMVAEGWTLSDVVAFAEEYKLNLTVYDSKKNIIPNTDYKKYSDTKVTAQSRELGDTIIEGFNFNINIDVNPTPESNSKYPDMVAENWTLHDVTTLATLYNLKLTVYDSKNNIIPSNDYKTYSNIKILVQSNPAETDIILGSSLTININTTYIAGIPNNSDIS